MTTKASETKTEKKSKKSPLSTLMAQAKEGLKYAELLAKPALENGRQRTNQKIKASLTALGLATKKDLLALEARVKDLETQLSKSKG